MIKWYDGNKEVRVMCWHQMEMFDISSNSFHMSDKSYYTKSDRLSYQLLWKYGKNEGKSEGKIEGPYVM